MQELASEAWPQRRRLWQRHREEAVRTPRGLALSPFTSTSGSSCPVVPKQHRAAGNL